MQGTEVLPKHPAVWLRERQPRFRPLQAQQQDSQASLQQIAGLDLKRKAEILCAQEQQASKQIYAEQSDGQAFEKFFWHKVYCENHLFLGVALDFFVIFEAAVFGE